jgi:FixJ family two-component response regulator
LENCQEPQKNEILLAFDNNEGECEALQKNLKEMEYRLIRVADEVALVRDVKENPPAAIVLDMTSLGAAGCAILERLKGYRAPVIVISEKGDIPTAVKAIKAGAQDFFQKPLRAEKIVSAIQEFRSQSTASASNARRPTRFHLPSEATLTPRERDVLAKILSGLSGKETAFALGISPRTVEDHRANIMRKFGVRSAAELMLVILKSNAVNAYRVIGR